MGFGLPGAIAANIVLPDRKVVAVVGDGGFMMNLQELETAVRLGCSFVVVIFNDSGYGSIDWKARNKIQRKFWSPVQQPRFCKTGRKFRGKRSRGEKNGRVCTPVEKGA
jgi:acetolactate synthase-1/2/3 large subunit